VSLIITYHAVAAARSPLCVDPGLFAAHADVIAESGMRSVTVRELAGALAEGVVENTVCITFDDGFASIVEHAAPLLEERDLTATVFCVAGHLGGTNDWPSARDGGYRSRLADASALSALASRGFEVGSHGMEHAPLAGASEAVLRREVSESRAALAHELGSHVTSYAYPYGALPGASALRLVGRTYGAACTTSLRTVSAGDDPHLLPRVDAHYLRSPERLQRALEGELGVYLRARGVAARARRTLVKDYALASTPGRSLSE
jgi:peptidoglycan/xylan/chitin deacetylase (PgdA/CDA1 family)